MHEASIAQSILKIVSHKVRATPNALRASRVHVIAGEFRNVDGDSLAFAFDHLKGFFEGAATCALELETIRARACCRDAEHQYHPQLDNAFKCSVCGSGIGKLICGEELHVVTISVEAKDEKECRDHA